MSNLGNLDAQANSAPALVKDIYPGVGSSNPGSFISHNGLLFFVADDGTNGRELWRSDGTIGGTYMVKDIYPGSGGSFPGEFTVYNNLLFFVATDDNGVAFGSDQGLWVTDGSSQNTVKVKNVNSAGNDSVSNLIVANGLLFFKADNGANGQELWVTDGSEGNTIRLVLSSFGYTNPMNPIVFKDYLYISGDGDDGRELWKTDGTQQNTVMVKDIHPTANSNPERFTVLNDELFFRANDGTHNIQIWKTDGTELNTVMVKDIYDWAFPDNLTVFDNKLYFTADDGVNGSELWVTDGNEANTMMLKHINPTASDAGYAYVEYMTVFDGKLYFSATNGVNGSELWSTDGTEAGTQMLVDIKPGADWSTPRHLTVANGLLFFVADNGTNGNEIWKSDGTVSGTVLVKDINPGAEPSSQTHAPSNLIQVNNLLFFNYTFFNWDNGNIAVELWRSDGTEDGTFKVSDVNSTGAYGSSDLSPIDSNLFFVSTDTDFGTELFVHVLDPNPLTGLIVDSATSDSIVLSWDASVAGNFDEYLVYYGNATGVTSLTGTLWNFTNDENLSLAGTTSTTVTGLTPNTEYFFSVYQMDTSGNLSESSDEVAAYTAPSSVSALTAEANGSHSVALSWSANNNPQGTIYEVYDVDSDSLVATTTNTKTTVSDLSPVTSYSFKVRTISSANPVVYVDSDPVVIATSALSKNIDLKMFTDDPQPVKFMFEGSNTLHTVVFEEIILDVPESPKVKFTISSDPVTVTLGAGESQSVDLGGSGSNDTMITVNTVDTVLGEFSFSLSDISPTIGGGSGGGGGGGIGFLSPSTNPTGLSNEGVESESQSFDDVNGHWGEMYIEKLREKGVVQGKRPGVFAPDDAVTRAELLKMMMEAYELSVPTPTASSFSDVELTGWFASYVEAAKSMGFIEGYADGSFRPNHTVNRVEALAIILKSSELSLDYSKAFVFPDTAAGSWYSDLVSFAVEKGVVQGYQNGLFGPSDSLTRAQAAKIIVLMMEMM
ncbi:hypothetical protein CVV38_01450 [Candidatus Peregrinibacteria bacterium HGW-Peregrinibacteria-1]|jgi:ELWxxDGT repeat protein|nr:MAG: hypothetical protein CVV38_01450 [Candidatus Peregrinibacteria bacterium HGW-Peregrinibacteria-1]